MQGSKKNTTKSDIANSKEEQRVHPLMKALGQYAYAAICIPFLRFLQSSINPSVPLRILFLIVERSWATLVPPAGYKGDGTDRRGWLPSLTAVRQVKQTKYGHWIIEPLRAVDIANELGLDKGNVSNSLKWLEARKVIKTEARGFAPSPTPPIEGAKKLSPETTFWAENPLFQQLEKLRLQIEAELEQAKRKALEPVIEAYRPKLEEVNTQQRKLKRELKKAAKTGDLPEKVVPIDNISKPTPTRSTVTKTTPPQTAAAAPPAAPEKVVSRDNFSELSPIPQVVSRNNFQPALNQGSKYPIKNNNNNSGSEAPSISSVAVAEVFEALRQHGTTTEKAAARLIADSKKANPQTTAAEIVHAIDELAAGFTPRTRSPIAVLLSEVPAALKSQKPATKGRRGGPAPIAHDMLMDQRRRLRSSDPSISSLAAHCILADPDADPQDQADAKELLAALQPA